MIRLISDVTVRPVQGMGGDQSVVGAMRVLEAVPPPDAGDAGRIRYLMRHRHATPFEHSAMTFHAHAPAFVWWEWVRHRWMSVDCPDMSFNLESGRWHELEPVFWVPREGRPLRPAEGHKPGRPKLEPDEPLHRLALAELLRAYREAWLAYRTMIEGGMAAEVARSVLPFSVYYSGWVTCHGVRNLMHFLSLRTHEPSAAFVSHPQAEIEEAARAAEELFRQGWPLTWAAFNEFGRVAP